MNQRQAHLVADALRGVAVREEVDGIQGGEWIVIFERPDGRLVVLSDTAVDEYGDRASFEAGHCYASISLL